MDLNPIEYLQQLNPKLDQNQCRTILGKLGIKKQDQLDLPLNKIRDLSGGQKQRIAIARAIYHNKSVLIMDEPTSALDPKNRDMILQNIINEMKNSTIIIITHNFDNLKYVDRVIDMNKGKIVSDSIKDIFY